MNLSDIGFVAKVSVALKFPAEEFFVHLNNMNMGSNSSNESAQASQTSTTATQQKRVINKTTIEPKPVQFTKFVLKAEYPNHEDEGTWFLNSTTAYLQQHGQNLTVISKTDSVFEGELNNLESLGLALEYLMNNRPYHLELQIRTTTENSDAKPIISFTSDCSTHLDPAQGGPSIPEADPKKRINVFHLHAHFDESTEGIAIGLHEATIKYLRGLKYDIHHYKVHYEKNGPHDKWSWEIQLKSFLAMAHGVAFLIFNNYGLYHPFHCRTWDDDIKNEYNDHAYRMGWIGEPDPQPLDLDFQALVTQR